MKRKYSELENQEIRAFAKEHGVCLKEVACWLKMSPSSLSRWLRYPLTKAQECLVRMAIKSIYEKKYEE